MNYVKFQNQFKNYLLIGITDIKSVYPDFDHRRLYEWQKNGYLKKVTNNYYVFADSNLNENNLNFIANKLYSPSYLSLEYALHYYALIPESVFLRTSVTSRKTKQFYTPIGNFSYQKIKNSIFFGYHLIKLNNLSFKIAEPEKAVLDFLYLRDDLKTSDDFFELRFNTDRYKEIINQKKLSQYSKKFDSKKISNKLKILHNVLKND